VDDVEELLQDVEALKEAIEERVRAIEDGSYWDDPDEWQHDYYYDEEPDYVTDEQGEELDNLFGAAGDLFISDQMEDARKVYGALLGLVKDIETIAYIPSQLNGVKSTIDPCQIKYSVRSAAILYKFSLCGMVSI
jgi:hypothetical protein